MKTRNIVCIVLLVGIALTSLFTIPYLFPMTEISSSESYNYGFNNRIGMLILGFFSLVFLGFSFFENTKSQQNIISDKSSEKIITPFFLIVTGITILGCLVLWVILEKNPYDMTTDLTYFIPHLYDLSWGKKIYQDFEFLYGPILLYFPYLIFRIFSFIPINIIDGYMMALILNQVLGLYFLQYVLSYFNFTSKERNIIFLVIAVCSFPDIVGLNYTLFRFVFPFFCFILIRRTDMHKKSTIANILIATILPVAVVLTSPELGIAFYFTLFVYKGVRYFYEKKITDLISIGIFIFSLLLVGYFFSNMFLGILGFTSGGMNRPFVLNPPSILFFISTFIVSWHIGIQVHDIKKYLFELSFALLAFALIPSALGRCDFRHIFFNGMFIFILAYSFIRIYSIKLKMTFGIIITVTSLVFFARAIQTNVFPIYKNLLITTLIKSDALPSWVVTLKNMDLKEKIQQIENDKKPNYNELFQNVDNITMPFVDNEMYVFLNESGKYVTLYYTNPGFLSSWDAVERNLKDLQEKQIKFLLLPATWDNKKRVADQVFIDQRSLFCSYFTAPFKRNGNVIFNPYIAFINDNYKYDRNIGDNFHLYKKK